MVFTKKDDDNQNKRIKKNKVKFYDTIFDDDEFTVTLQRNEDGQYQLYDDSQVQPIVESEEEIVGLVESEEEILVSE